MNRHAYYGGKLELQRCPGPIAKVREPCAVRVRALVHRADEQARVFEEISGQRSWPAITDRYRPFLFEIVVKRSVFSDFGLRVFDSIVCGSRRSQLRITRNRVAQFLFSRCERRPG